MDLILFLFCFRTPNRCTSDFYVVTSLEQVFAIQTLVQSTKRFKERYCEMSRFAKSIAMENSNALTCSEQERYGLRT